MFSKVDINWEIWIQPLLIITQNQIWCSSHMLNYQSIIKNWIERNTLESEYSKLIWLV